MVGLGGGAQSENEFGGLPNGDDYARIYTK